VYGLIQNNNEVDDNWFGFGEMTKYAYFTFEILQTYFEGVIDNPQNFTPSLFSLSFLEHEREDHTQRQVQTLFTLLSDLGGFLEIITFITGIIVYYNQKFYFDQTLVKELFMEN